MDLHELAPVGGRATCGRDRRQFKWFTQVRENLTSRGLSHPGLLPLANLRFDVSRLLPAVSSAPDVAGGVRALKRKLLPDPGHQCGLPPATRPDQVGRLVSQERVTDATDAAVTPAQASSMKIVVARGLFFGFAGGRRARLTLLVVSRTPPRTLPCTVFAGGGG